MYTRTTLPDGTRINSPLNQFTLDKKTTSQRELVIIQCRSWFEFKDLPKQLIDVWCDMYKSIHWTEQPVDLAAGR